MKVVLFCGGFGTRLREHSETIPKPLVGIGYRPIIWYLMKYYSHFGHKEFILCLGYRGDLIKEYFIHYDEWKSNDCTISGIGRARSIELANSDINDWRVTFIDTGLNSNIGQRLLAVREYLAEEEVFLANYSDGLTDLPLDDYIKDFYESGAIASFVSVRPSQSLSGVTIDEDDCVTHIGYLRDSDVWINGGFFIMRKEIFNYINDGEELVEEPFQRLIGMRRLKAYKYYGFWAAMDTFKDKKTFDDMYARGDRPWAVWSKAQDVCKITGKQRQTLATSVRRPMPTSLRRRKAC